MQFSCIVHSDISHPKYKIHLTLLHKLIYLYFLGHLAHEDNFA